MAFEQIVRPFQSPGAVNETAVQVTRPVIAAPELAILQWGAAGQDAQIGDASGGAGMGGLAFKVIDKDNQLKEVSRKTHVVKIVNPNDDQQFVKEQKIDQIKFKQTPSLLKTPSQSGTDNTSGGGSQQTVNNSGHAGGVETNTAYAAPPSSQTVNNPTIGNTNSQKASADQQQDFALSQP